MPTPYPTPGGSSSPSVCSNSIQYRVNPREAIAARYPPRLAPGDLPEHWRTRPFCLYPATRVAARPDSIAGTEPGEAVC
jgi:hypothetical protein